MGPGPQGYIFNPNVLSFVPDKDVLMAIGKRLGERILVQKQRDFDVANETCNKLRNKYVVEIDDQNKEWMVVAPRSGRWSKDDNGEGDEALSNCLCFYVVCVVEKLK